MPQNQRAIAQVGAQLEQVVVGVADGFDPERHHLRVAARAHRRHRVLAETAFDLDQAEHQLRVDPRARGFPVQGGQKLQPLGLVWHALGEPARHILQPGCLIRSLPKRRAGDRGVGQSALQGRTHIGRHGFLALVARMRGQGEQQGGDQQADVRCLLHVHVSAPISVPTILSKMPSRRPARFFALRRFAPAQRGVAGTRSHRPRGRVRRR